MKIRYIIIAALVIAFINGCETSEKIDDFPLRPSRLVVNSYFTTDSTWEFQVSKSLSVLDNAELQLVKDASINIFKDGVLLDTIRQADMDGWYRSSVQLPFPGVNYSIEVSSASQKSILLAEDYVPLPVPITKVDLTISDSSIYREIYYDYYLEDTIENFWGNIEGTFEISFKDPPGIENFYQLSVYSYRVYYDYGNPDIYYTESWPISFSTDDPVADDNSTYIQSLEFSDEIIDGKNYQIKLDFDDWVDNQSGMYIIELVSLSRSAYFYKRSVKEYLNASGDPFSEPVLIYSNIENGYGIFAGYSNSTNTVKIFD